VATAAVRFVSFCDTLVLRWYKVNLCYSGKHMRVFIESFVGPSRFIGDIVMQGAVVLPFGTLDQLRTDVQNIVACQYVILNCNMQTVFSEYLPFICTVWAVLFSLPLIFSILWGKFMDVFQHAVTRVLQDADVFFLSIHAKN
jgi:hypothetical protein